MKHPVLCDNAVRPLPFYLAMEEWVAEELPAADYFFAWRVHPTVICGRNQDIEAEVALDYCRAEGIDVVRRRSGGGCVYADMNNWMFSYITPSTGVEATFGRYTSMIAAMLGSLGFEARATGRNDLVIGDRKVAGNAFYSLPGRSIVHGTMLCDIDFGRMARAITPSKAKMQSKAVTSVASRVTSLKAEGLTMTVEEFGRYAVDFLTRGDDILVDAVAVARIERRALAYRDPEYFRGRRRTAESDAPRPDIERTAYIEGTGQVTALLYLDTARRIRNVVFTGDFFVLGDLEGELAAQLRSVEYSEDALSRAIAAMHPERVIAGLTGEKLLRLLI